MHRDQKLLLYPAGERHLAMETIKGKQTKLEACTMSLMSLFRDVRLDVPLTYTKFNLCKGFITVTSKIWQGLVRI